MQRGKEMRVTPYAMNPAFSYLADEDRYLFAPEKAGAPLQRHRQRAERHGAHAL